MADKEKVLTGEDALVAKVSRYALPPLPEEQRVPKEKRFDLVRSVGTFSLKIIMFL